MDEHGLSGRELGSVDQRLPRGQRGERDRGGVNEVQAVGISVTKVSTNFVLGASVYADNGQYDALFISNYIDRFIRDDLKRIPGVGPKLEARLLEALERSQPPAVGKWM